MCLHCHSEVTLQRLPWHAAAMAEPFIGSEAVAAGDNDPQSTADAATRVCSGTCTSSKARNSRQRSELIAAWLWSRRPRRYRRLFGRSHSRQQMDRRDSGRGHHPRQPTPAGRAGIRSDAAGERRDRHRRRRPVTTPARTALDLACWYPTTTAVAAIDALARATELKMPDVESAGRTLPRTARHSNVLATRWILSTRARNRRKRRGCDWS